MLSTQTEKSPVQCSFQGSLNNHLEICRLLAAAVVSPSFCRLLLEQPEAALCSGYQGEKFFLSELESSLFLSIRADSLAALSTQLVQVFGEQSVSFIPQPAQTDIFSLLEQ